MKGIIIVFLGPDGSGKSSVIEQIIPILSPKFQRTCYIHLHPRFGIKAKGKSTPVTNPHGQLSRGLLSSTAKLLYFLNVYCFGYLLKIRPMMIQNTLVIFDRYYHDLLVDPIRYRYGGPMWFARWVAKLIPKPDFFILLDAPPEVLQSRKQEVPFEETVRQRQAYLELVRGMKNGLVVGASQSLDEVVAEICEIILGFMSKRTAKRFGVDR